MLQFSTVPIVKHWQYHNDVGENAQLLPWWIIIPAPCKHQRWLLFPTMAPVVSALILVCFPERQTGFLQFWPSVTPATCYIFTSSLWLSSHILTTRKQCLSAKVAYGRIQSRIHCPRTCCILLHYDHKHQFTLSKVYVKDEPVKRFYSHYWSSHHLMECSSIHHSTKEDDTVPLQSYPDTIRADNRAGVHWSAVQPTIGCVLHKSGFYGRLANRMLSNRKYSSLWVVLPSPDQTFQNLEQEPKTAIH